MKWLSWVSTGLFVTLGSVCVVHVLAAIVIAASGPAPHRGYDTLALAAVDIVGGIGSFLVSVIVMPIILANGESPFEKRSSVLISGGVVAAIAVLLQIMEGFDLGIILFAVPSIISAMVMAIIAHNNVNGGW